MSGTGLYENDAAKEFLTQLRQTKHAAGGDLLASTLRGVIAPKESPLPAAAVSAALVAVAVLLSEREPSTLDGAPEEEALRAFVEDLDTELTPARRIAAQAVLGRVRLAEENEWQRQWSEAGLLDDALAPVRRLQELLADAGS